MDSGIVELVRGSSLNADLDNDLQLRHVALACIGRLLFAEEGEAPKGPEQSYVFRVYEPLRHVELRHVLDHCLTNPADRDRPLLHLARLIEASEVEVIALVLALMVEEEPMMGRVLAHIQAPVGGARPTLGLLESALLPLSRGGEGWVTGDLMAGRAIATGALLRVNQQSPLPEQALKLPLGLALLLRDGAFVWPGCSAIDGSDGIRLPPSIEQLALRHADALGRSEDGLLLIRSASRRESRAVASAVAARLERSPVLVATEPDDHAGLGLACRVAGHLPVFELTLAAEQQVTLPRLAGYAGPRLALAGPDGHVVAEHGTMLQWQLEAPTRQERHDLWAAYLGEDALAQALADEHIHSAGRIAELADLASREARLRRRDRPQMEDIRSAAWEAEAGLLGSLAQPIKAEIPDDALVVSKPVRRELQQLLARCRGREGLDEALGVTIKARYQHGVRCLITGPSGTGKTLAAGWLATRLGLPLYRVDLAAVVSKYIGETEKNLASLLARAEHSEILLLFDEADSLFGKRTDIKDSNDRFANSQTNYLLQRIEFYRGIVLLTSNSRERFDTAFTRRLDKIIEFPLPNPQERRALWLAHLGAQHGLGPLQINQLAAISDLAGGHIRNAVLTAAVEAKAAQRPITYEDVVVGLAGEYRKLGRQFPVELRRHEQATQRARS